MPLLSSKSARASCGFIAGNYSESAERSIISAALLKTMVGENTAESAVMKNVQTGY